MTTLSRAHAYAPPIPTDTPWTLDVLGAPAVAFSVYGTPKPQGSKKAMPIYRGRGPSRVFTGKVNLVEQVEGVDEWRQEVAEVARLVMRATSESWLPLAGALVADMVFTVKRPQRFPKNKPDDMRWAHGHPTGQQDGDLDKLLRATMDGISASGLWADDSRVIGYRKADQMYLGTADPDVLRKPGAVIRVWKAPATVIDRRLGRL